MNLTELRETLDDLAGPVEAPSETQRQAVRRRVRRARLVRATSAVAVSLAVVVGAIAIVDAANDDRPTPVVAGEGTTIHDEQLGFTVTIPPGWAREAAAVGSLASTREILRVTRDYTAANPSRSLEELEAARTLEQFNDLLPIQAERQNLEQQLNTLPPGTAERAEIEARIDDLNDQEVQIRSRPSTNNVPALNAQRRTWQQEVDALSPGDARRTRLQQLIAMLDDVERNARSRAEAACASVAKPTGVLIRVQESSILAEPRPGFGPETGSGLNLNATNVCVLQQDVAFRDGDRSFLVSITMAPDTSPARQAEAYAILNSLRFDPTPTPSTGVSTNESSTTTFARG